LDHLARLVPRRDNDTSPPGTWFSANHALPGSTLVR